MVTEVSEGTAKVSVLRKEACASCSGRYFCGSSKKMESKVSDPIGVSVGDTVEVEAKSGVMLGYAALLFLAPIVSAVALYFALGRVGGVWQVIGAIAGFVLPYLVALVIEKNTSFSLPVITRVETQRSAKSDPDCRFSQGGGDGKTV